MKGQISLEEYITQRPKTEWGGCGECYRRFVAKQDRDAERRNG